MLSYFISLIWVSVQLLGCPSRPCVLPSAGYAPPFVTCFLITDNAPQLKEILRYEWCTVAVFIVVNCCWCCCCCCCFALRAVFYVRVDTSLSCIWTVPWYYLQLTCNGCWEINMAGKSNHFEMCGISSNLCHLFALCVNVIWINS